MLHPERIRLIPRRKRVTVAVVIVLATFGLVVACTSGGGDDQTQDSEAPQLSLPPPTYDDVAVVTLPEGFVQPDTRGVRLSPVVARPKGGVPSLPVYGGTASIGGQVVGPDGPVGGATVKLERWVGGRSGSVTIPASGEGRFGARNLLGGRYRVRAWLEPSLTATESQVVFLANEGGSANVTVDVSRFEGLQLQASLDVASLNVEETRNVRALLTRAAVDGDGIVVGEPVPLANIQLTVPQGLTIDGANPVITGADGRTSWRVRCDREGSYTVSLTTEGASASYTLPTCGPKPTTTTTTPGAGDIPAFAVGEEFTVPRAAPLPPGTYTTFLDGCATSFEAFVDGAWQPQRREIRGVVMGLVVPTRNFQPVTGTDGCRYRRTA